MHHRIMAKSKLELKVEGMTCDGCVRSVERKLSKVAGVESARVDLGAGRRPSSMTIREAQVDQLIAAVEQIGFHASRSMNSAEEVELPIGGMTCAACARTVERQLASSPGVEKASVNFATQIASVSYNPAQTRIEDLVAAVEDVGYEVPREPQEIAEAAEARELRRRLIVGAVFAIPVFVLG